MSHQPNAPLVRTVRVACGIERAFETFTAGIDLWWPQSHRRFPDSRMVLEAFEGGRFLEVATDGSREALLGNVVRFDPPGRLAYTWYPGALTGPTLVEVRFNSGEGHTFVEIVHSEGESGLGEEWPRRAERFASAWGEVLPCFAKRIEIEEGT